MIILKNISRKYKKQQALTNINLSFKSKGLVFITGENGSGKTTLLNIIGLIDRGYTGTLLINNENVGDLSEKKLAQIRSNQMSFIFQNNNLIDDLTVSQNIKIYKKIKNIDHDDESLFANEMEKLNRKYPCALSGGERQKVSVIRGLLDGNIILCDEPTASLDYQSTINTMEQLKEISKEKLVIVVMHAIDLVEKYGDRIIELKSGEIIKDITLNEQEKIDISEANKTVSLNSSLFLLVFSFFKKRLFKTSMFIFLITVFSILLSLFASLLVYDSKNELSKRFLTNDSLSISKRITVMDPFINNEIDLVLTSGNEFLSSVRNTFEESEYDYIAHSEYGKVHFTNLYNLSRGEVLVDIKTYGKLFNSTDFVPGQVMKIRNDSIGYSNLELEIIGISPVDGIYAAKENLNRNYLEANIVFFHGGMFKNNSMAGLHQYYYEQPCYMKLSYLKKIAADIGIDISDWEFAHNEIGISEKLLEYIDIDFNDHSGEVLLDFIDIPTDIDPYLYNSFVDLKRDVFRNGASLIAQIPNNFAGYNKVVVVSDTTFDQILARIPLYDSISLNVTATNKWKIANFFIQHEYRLSDSTQEYVAFSIPQLIHDGIILISGLVAVFSISLLIIFSILLSAVFLSKKNEIGLLQTFGLPKAKSLLPATIIMLLIGLISLLLSLLLSTSIFGMSNKVMFSINNFNAPLFIFNYKVVLIMIFSQIIFLSIVYAFSHRKISKFTPQEIFKFND